MLPNVSNMGFQNCCGIWIVSGHITQFKTSVPLTPLERKSAKLDLEERIKAARPKIGILLMALNNLQVLSGLGEVFEEVGFKVLMKDVLHAGTKSRLTLYGLDLHEERDRVEKECKFKGFS